LIADALNIPALPRSLRRSVDLPVVSLANGAMLSLPVNIIVGSAPGPCLALVAGVHGDEGEGVLALMELWNEIAPSEIRGCLLIVPVANPPAFAAHRRTSPIDELDLNRLFPGKPDGKPSERIAHCLFNSVLKHANFVFSMHSWYISGVVLPYVEYMHHGATAPASLAAAKASGFDIIRISDWSPGLMTRAVNEAGIPGIEAEIGGTGISTLANRMRYKAHIRDLMAHLSMGPSTSASLLNSAEPRIVDYVDLVSPAGGVFHVSTKLGAEIAPGDSLASIASLHGETCGEIVSRHRGFIGGMWSAASVQAGDLVFRIFTGVDSDR
jgi:predicted deacylase